MRSDQIARLSTKFHFKTAKTKASLTANLGCIPTSVVWSDQTITNQPAILGLTSLPDPLLEAPLFIGQDVVSSCVFLQRTFTPKFAAALAEAITAPAMVLKLTPKVTSISSG